jgi:predicted CXXCH cytochrome family protein
MMMWPVTSLLAHLWHPKRANERQLPTNTVGRRARLDDGSGAFLPVAVACRSRSAPLPRLSGRFCLRAPQPPAGRSDGYLPALLEPGIYHADGQIDGEVYEYGSFLQSRMYHFGVSCSDCHDPHSAKLRADGNALCAQCHMPAKFDAAERHHHQPGSADAQCVNCHMPTKNYMVVDARRDHSIRVCWSGESAANSSLESPGGPTFGILFPPHARARATTRTPLLQG